MIKGGGRKRARATGHICGGELVSSCGWCRYSVERKRGRQRLVVCCLVKEGQLNEHSGARSCDGGHEK